MQMTGQLSEISWSDLLRLLDLSQVSGCLTIQHVVMGSSQFAEAWNYHFWVEQGAIAGFSYQLDDHCLLSLVHKQGWVSYRTLQRIANSLPKDTPLGVHLKQQGLLSFKQLHWLFRDQVLGPIQQVADLQEASFSFKTLQDLPQMEMTGLKLPIYEMKKCLTLQVA